MILGIIILCVFFLFFALLGFFCVRFSSSHTRLEDDHEQEQFLQRQKSP
jgi:uncharacterized protein YneF (UPF0154 family)